MRRRSKSFIPLAAAALAAGALAFAGAAGADSAPTIRAAVGPVTSGLGDVGTGASDTFQLGRRQCKLIAVPEAAPIGRSRCRGVRPGALVETRVGFCTMNFLFRDRDGRRYVGTAGHCILNNAGERQWPRGGPVARSSGGRVIGRFRYATQGFARDFALIRLKQGVRASPRMCHFGGPTGVSFSRTRRTVALNLYGDGILVGAVSPGRTLFANGLRNPHHLFAKGITTDGDSGAPVTIRGRGRAVGLLIATGFAIGGGHGDAGALITRIPPRERRAERLTGERFEIITARQR
jgi:hypothetical protein